MSYTLTNALRYAVNKRIISILPTVPQQYSNYLEYYINNRIVRYDIPRYDIPHYQQSNQPYQPYRPYQPYQPYQLYQPYQPYKAYELYQQHQPQRQLQRHPSYAQHVMSPMYQQHIEQFCRNSCYKKIVQEAPKLIRRDSVKVFNKIKIIQPKTTALCITNKTTLLPANI